jgi:hypothetical protein
MLLVVFLLVVVFVVGLLMILMKEGVAFGAGGHPKRACELFSGGGGGASRVMLDSGLDAYAVRRFAGAMAAFDPYGWDHGVRAPVTVVGPVGDGWKKAFNGHLTAATLAMLDEIMTFHGCVFVFARSGFNGEMFVLPIEIESLPSVEFVGRELLDGLKWLAPATIMSAVVPVGRAMVLSLENGIEVVAKEGLNATLNVTAPIKKIVVRKV